MQSGHWVLRDRQPLAIEEAGMTPDEWWAWFKNPDNRRVAYDAEGRWEVSTAFLAIGFPPEFETLYRWDGEAIRGIRSPDWREAELVHHALVDQLKAWPADPRLHLALKGGDR